MISANLILAWLWILLGFGTGMLLGVYFHRENFLGGYGSHRRRLYRLAHISFFGLGFTNLCFWLTARELNWSGTALAIASAGFVAGAVTMPVCCVLMAHFQRAHLLFAIPVLSLLTAASLVLKLLLS